MPKFLEEKLRKEYGNNPHAIYGTMNKLGAMKGNKETAKGRAMEKKHEAKMEVPYHSTHIQHHGDGSHTVEHTPHMKSAGKSGAFMEHGESTSYSVPHTKGLVAKLGEHLGAAKPEPAEHEMEEEGGEPAGE